MRLTIIPSDGYVAIDGVGKTLSFNIDPDIHAVQWDDTQGFVELKSGGARFIDHLDEFDAVIDLFNAPDPVPDQPTLAEAIAAKLQELSAIRYQKETGGFSFNGVSIATDDRSKTLLMGARIEAKEAIDSGGDYVISWKSLDGFIDINAVTIIAISNAMRAFVQACFNAEKTHTAAISALALVDDVTAYDLTTGWPE